GVAEVRARVVADVSADVPGVDDLVTLRVISVPARERAILNGVYLHAGRLPERDDEITINEAFAEANKLTPDAILSATLNGHKQRLRVVGIGVSPGRPASTPPSSSGKRASRTLRRPSSASRWPASISRTQRPRSRRRPRRGAA